MGAAIPAQHWTSATLTLGASVLVCCVQGLGLAESASLGGSRFPLQLTDTLNHCLRVRTFFTQSNDSGGGSLVEACPQGIRDPHKVLASVR